MPAELPQYAKDAQNEIRLREEAIEAERLREDENGAEKSDSESPAVCFSAVLLVMGVLAPWDDTWLPVTDGFSCISGWIFDSPRFAVFYARRMAQRCPLLLKTTLTMIGRYGVVVVQMTYP
jgi:hypothetical protein